mgnify:CR=1 FL=1
MLTGHRLPELHMWQDEDDTGPPRPLQVVPEIPPTMPEVRARAQQYERVLAAPHGKPHRVRTIHAGDTLLRGHLSIEAAWQSTTLRSLPLYLLSVVSSISRARMIDVSTLFKVIKKLPDTSSSGGAHGNGKARCSRYWI